MLTSEQLSEWEAYERLDPVGEIRSDIRFARLSSLILNLFKIRFGKKGAKMTEPRELMPKWDDGEPEEQEPQSIEEMKENVLKIGTIFKSKK